MDRETLLREMLHEFPRTIKKLSSGVRFPAGMPRQMTMLLHCIMMHDGRSMSFYSDHLMLPKSNLTAAADRLISEGHVRRETDDGDRRVIYLHITDSGREYICRGMGLVFSDCLKKLECLDDSEFLKLTECVSHLRVIADKISGAP